jgi:hypothetical protein
MRDGTTKVRMSRTEGKEKMEEEWGVHKSESAEMNE